MERFFGGRPFDVILRLAIISVIVGVVFAALGLDPLQFWSSVKRLTDWFYETGLHLLNNIFGYFLLGALVVIPIWVVYRLIKMAGGSGRAADRDRRDERK